MALHTFDCLQLDLSFLYLLLKFLQLDHLLYSADYAVMKLDNILRMRSVIVRDGLFQRMIGNFCKLTKIEQEVWFTRGWP